MSEERCTKRAKTSPSVDDEPVEDPELRDLFRESIIDEEAVIKIIQKKPSATKTRYYFTTWANVCFPLHVAIKRKVSLNLVSMIYEAYPPALMETTGCPGELALHCACKFKASIDVVSFLLDKDPLAVELPDVDGWTSLHYACANGSSFDVVSLLLEKYPPAVKIQGHIRRTPLHFACIHRAPVEVVSLLLDKYPEAAKIQDLTGSTPLHHANRSKNSPSLEVIYALLKSYPDAMLVKDFAGMTPLHRACKDRRSPVKLKVFRLMLTRYPEASMVVDDGWNTPLHAALMHGLSVTKLSSLKIIALLLEKNPFAVNTKNNENHRPIDYWRGESPIAVRGTMMLSNIGLLVNKSADRAKAMEMIKDFAQIKWRGGIRLVFDLYPPICAAFEDVSLSVMPSLFAMMGRRCNMSAVWNMLINRQDILKIE